MIAAVIVEVITFVEIPGTAKSCTDAFWIPMATAVRNFLADKAAPPRMQMRVLSQKPCNQRFFFFQLVDACVDFLAAEVIQPFATPITGFNGVK